MTGVKIKSRLTMENNKHQAAFYGWKLVAAVFVIYLINTAFPYYGASVLNAYMADDLGFSRSALGFGFSAFILLVGVTSPIVGILVNRLGVRLTLTGGGLILALGSLAMATIARSELHYYLLFGALCGLGFSLGGIIPVQSVVTYWFRRRKPLAMSLVLCASGVGSAVSIPILNAVVEAFDGNWRAGWYVVTGFCIFSAFTALLWVRNKPEDMGQHPDGDSVDAAAGETPAAMPASRVHQTERSWSVAEAFSTRASWIMILATCAFAMLFNMCVAHGVVHLRDQGVDGALAATSVGLLVLASVIGRLGAGTIGGGTEPRFIWSLGLLLMVVGLLALGAATSSWQVYVYALGVGAGFGASYVSMANMLGNYFGTESFAPMLGILTTIVCVVGALSPALAGIAYDSFGAYTLAFNGHLLIAALGCLLIPFAGPPPPADHATPASP